MEKSLCAICCATILMFSAQLLQAEMGPPVGKDKKLIGWGVNAVDSAYLRAHVSELEKEYAIDGMVIAFAPDDWKSSVFQTCGLFGGRTYTHRDFRKTITNLNQTRFTRFTDNFLYLCTSVRGTSAPKEQNVDWFDARWSNIASNMALYSEMAKTAGFKGLMLDFEYYKSDFPLWRYFEYKTFADYYQKSGKALPSFEDYAVQLRKRGREMMEAVTAAYPDITIIMIPFTGWGRMGGYDLLSAFVDGMLEGAGPKVTLIDGGEMGYERQTYKSFMDLRREAARKGIKKSKVPDLYENRIKQGFGFWIDYDPGLYGGWYTDPEQLEKNYRSPSRLEYGLYNALTASDRYVWLYVWHPQYFWNPDSRRKENLNRQAQNQCVFCPHSVMPQEYLDAFRKCRKPHELDWKPVLPKIAEKTYSPEQLAAIGKNIFKNGDFEVWRKGKNQAPDNWILGGDDPVVARQRSSVKSGSFTAALSSAGEEGHIYIDQRIPVDKYRGKTIIFGAWVKADSEENAFVSIMDWAGDQHELNHNLNKHPLDGTWQFLTARKTIREDATGEIWFRLNARPYESGAVACFDGAVAVVQE